MRPALFLVAFDGVGHGYEFVLFAIEGLLAAFLAVGELLLFMAVVAPDFSVANLHKGPLPNGWGGAFAALPFAIWFYLAIEGVANAAEEARNPQRNVAIGFGAAIVTLVVLALGVFLVTRAGAPLRGARPLAPEA